MELDATESALQDHVTFTFDLVSMFGLWCLNQYRKRAVAPNCRCILPCYSLAYSGLMGTMFLQAIFVYLTLFNPAFVRSVEAVFVCSRIVLFLMEGVKEIIIDGWTMLMHQPGVGRKALKNVLKVCVLYGALWSTVIVVVGVLQASELEYTMSRTLFVFSCFRSVVYTLVFASTVLTSHIPTFRRRTLRIFAATMALEASYIAMYLSTFLTSGSLLIPQPVHTVLFSFICTARNVVVYWAMARDTRYWTNDLDDHEMDKVNEEVDQNVSDIRRPILGLSLEDGAGRVIGRQFDRSFAFLLVDTRCVRITQKPVISPPRRPTACLGVRQQRKLTPNESNICVNFSPSLKQARSGKQMLRKQWKL